MAASEAMSLQGSVALSAVGLGTAAGVVVFSARWWSCRRRDEPTRTPLLLEALLATAALAVVAGVLDPLWTWYRPNLAGWSLNTNLVPLRGIADMPARWILLNLAMLVPLGFLARLRWPSLPVRRIAVYGAVFSLTIEIGQLLHGFHSADVDDVLLNITGSALGAWSASALATRTQLHATNE